MTEARFESKSFFHCFVFVFPSKFATITPEGERVRGVF